MIIKHNGQNVVLPDIPENFLKRYPYVWIGYQIYSEFYLLIGSYSSFFHRQLDERTNVILPICAGGVTRSREYDDGSISWIISDEITEDASSNDMAASLSNDGGIGAVEFLWANHDIHEFVITSMPNILSDDIWYISNSEDYQESYVVSSKLIKKAGDIARMVSSKS